MMKYIYINFLFLFLYQISFGQYPISVGFISLDDQIRNLQLLNKIDSNQSFLNRPFYTKKDYTYDFFIFFAKVLIL